jgi:hypothetical protein
MIGKTWQQKEILASFLFHSGRRNFSGKTQSAQKGSAAKTARNRWPDAGSGRGRRDPDAILARSESKTPAISATGRWISAPMLRMEPDSSCNLRLIRVSLGGFVQVFKGIVIGAPISLALWGLILWVAIHV